MIESKMGNYGLILKKAESVIAKKGKNRITERILGYTTKAYKGEGGNLLRKSKRTAASAALPQDMAAYLFHQGTNFYAYEYHLSRLGTQRRVCFGVR